MMNNENKIWLDTTVKNIYDKMEWVSVKSKDKIPATTVNGEYDNKIFNPSGRFDDGLQWWTNGFFAGIMWHMFNETNEQKYADIASNTETWLDQCFDNFYGLHHDVGFMWLPSAIAHYRKTGNPISRKRGLHAANLLAGRFNHVGKFIRAWDGLEQNDTRGWAIIDCMLNIPLLYWATEETTDPRYAQIAEIHATTVMENFIREDGSSEHIVEFDPYKGGKVRIYGGQGYADGSAWTRGQSWALYGFVMSYIHTKNEAFLETAIKVSDYFCSKIPENGLIPCDFDQPADSTYEDSTASAIASCGLIELAKYLPGEAGEKYKAAAIKLLKSLTEQRCSWATDCDHILEECTGAYHGDTQHISLVYADFFFIEAIYKLKGDDLYMW